uniref:Uncharacterized protein n=1 Tax=Anguilla anguilla TaxID=7936 RepID=A0A0E9WJ30_ANGAN
MRYRQTFHLKKNVLPSTLHWQRYIDSREKPLLNASLSFTTLASLCHAQAHSGSTKRFTIGAFMDPIILIIIGADVMVSFRW